MKQLWEICLNKILTALTPILGEIYGCDLEWDIERGYFIAVYARGYDPFHLLFRAFRLEWEVPVLILTPIEKELTLEECKRAENALWKLNETNAN